MRELFLWVLAAVLASRVLAGETAQAVATILAGSVSGISVTSGGSGYLGEPEVTLSGGGGSGALAKAVLLGDQVAAIVVLASGSGYSSAPIVTIAPPQQPLGVRLRLVPELTVEGPPGSAAKVEWSQSLSGPWTTWSNVFLGSGGVVLVDLSPGTTQRFYRAVVDPRPPGPPGFAWIPPGTFVMGSPSTEPDRHPDELEHLVTLTQGFWISDHEVTQAEYEDVTGNNPSFTQGDGSHPVEQVSWNDAVLYCQKLTERERSAEHITASWAYRLPTEAEWEYAARAGTTGTRHGELDSIAWWSGNSGGRTRPVKQKNPNPWGVYDTMGNVWEWCSDWYGSYPAGSATNPAGPASGPGRVLRGGSWVFGPSECRSAIRRSDVASAAYYNLGFRPVLAPVR